MQFKVLGGHEIGNSHRLLQICDLNKKCALLEHRANRLGVFECFQLRLDRGLDRGALGILREDVIDLFPTCSVFCLGEQIGRQPSRFSRFIGNRQCFTRTRQQFDTHGAKNLALRLGNVGVSGSKNLVDRRDCRRAVSHCAHGLGTSKTIDLLHPT